MKKWLSLLISAMAIVALSGCAGIDDVGDGFGGSSLTKDYVDPVSTTNYNSSINLMNSAASDERICNAYSSPSDANTWTTLSGTPIAPGDEHEWGSNRCDEKWDLKVEDCAGHTSTYTYFRECYTTTYFTFKNW